MPNSRRPPASYSTRRTDPPSARPSRGGYGLHPGTRILLYVFSALAVPGLSLSWLGVLAVLLAPFCVTRLTSLALLFRRTRLLFLLLVIATAYTLPGEALWPVLAGLSPSREGLLQGLLQASRLAVLLLLLDLLVLRMPADDLLTGVHEVLRPFNRFGLDAQRIALRLALTLRAMERPRGLAGFREVLAGRAPDDDLPAVCLLSLRPFADLDRWVLLAGLATLVLCLAA